MAIIFNVLALLLLNARYSLAICDCYKTDAGDVFSKYEFLDFRNGRPATFDNVFRPLDVSGYGPNTVTNTLTSANVISSRRPSLKATSETKLKSIQMRTTWNY